MLLGVKETAVYRARHKLGVMNLKYNTKPMKYRVAVTYREPEKLGAYVNALSSCGIEAIPLLPDRKHSIDEFNGLLLSGGTDINPYLYGQERIAVTDEPDCLRDEMEKQLLKEALVSNLPILAICRGMQLFNVFYGGTLIQHLNNSDKHHHRFSDDIFSAVHSVNIQPKTRLAEICGSGLHTVNSRHHQGIQKLGAGLIASAISYDGLIEAIEDPNKYFAVAVQWHPEDRIKNVPKDAAIVTSFVNAVRNWSIL